MMPSSIVKQLGIKNTFYLVNGLKEYFEDKRLVKKVLKETNFVFFNSDLEYQQIINDIDNDEEALKLLKYSMACAMNSFNSYIEDDELVVVAEQTKIISPTINDLNNIDWMDAFIHELFHSIKSYENKLFDIQDGFVLRSGLLYTYYYPVQNENGKIVLDNERKGRGLEEYFNELQTEEFLKNYIYGNLDLTRDFACCDYYAPLFNNNNFRTYLVDAQLYGKKEEFIDNFNKLTSSAYNEFEELADQLYEEKCLINPNDDFSLYFKKYEDINKYFFQPIYEEYFRKEKENAGNCRSRNSKKNFK